MSKLYDMRRALADAIIAADIGWCDDDVILKRQTDLWNDVATAMSTARNGAVLHIGIVEGAAKEGYGLMMDLTVPLTIICAPQVTENATPEEDLWEQLIIFVQGLRLSADDHCMHEFQFKSFSDADIEVDGGTRYLARQTMFTKTLYISGT